MQNQDTAEEFAEEMHHKEYRQLLILEKEDRSVSLQYSAVGTDCIRWNRKNTNSNHHFINEKH